MTKTPHKIFKLSIKGRVHFHVQMVPGVIIDDARHPPKNATVKNFTSTDFLGPIKFDSPNGGTSTSRMKKNVNSPFKHLLFCSKVYGLFFLIFTKYNF